MPYRKVASNWKVVVLSVLIVAAFLVASLMFRLRSNDLQRLIYQNCVANETQDAIIVTQLQAAKARALASLPLNSDIAREQIEILNDGINALEPSDERECNPPRGTEP